MAMRSDGDLAGEELGVGEVALVAGAVLLERDPVAVVLAVLREQDQRRGVGRLQAEDEREEDERRTGSNRRRRARASSTRARR